MAPKIYLILSAFGLGDVWELKAGDSLAARLTSSAEVPNPNSAAASGTGPFYGDRELFTSALGSGNVANVISDFGGKRATRLQVELSSINTAASRQQPRCRWSAM